MGLYVTLNEIRACSPCEEGWKKLLKHLGKTQADDTKVSFTTILESNGIDDTFWAIQALPEKYENAVRLLNCDIAERALRFVPDGDDRARKAIEASRAFAAGDATQEELAAARDAAWDAARDAARAAARAAAWGARDAARAAARAAAWGARDAAWAAEISEQEVILIAWLKTQERT